MKYIFVFASLFSIILYSCGEAKTTNNEDNLNVELDYKSYFSPQKAYEYVKKQTDMGPRSYGSEAHKRVREFFKEEMTNLGYEVFSHKFKAPYIEGREGENIYAFLKGKRSEYVIIASHFDSRSVAEKDNSPQNRNKAISGANDGASSSGVLLELMSSLKKAELPYSVCFILFDLEDDGDLLNLSGDRIIETDWIQGSIAFNRDKILDAEKIKFGILIDMVGASNAEFKYESLAYSYYPNIYEKIWDCAHSLRYGDYFIKENYGIIIDDHIPFIYEAVPFVNVIDMRYPYHHTQEDTIDKIDVKTLEAVGKTVEYAIRNADKIN